jgi:hypothetical protein
LELQKKQKLLQKAKVCKRGCKLNQKELSLNLNLNLDLDLDLDLDLILWVLVTEAQLSTLYDDFKDNLSVESCGFALETKGFAALFSKWIPFYKPRGLAFSLERIFNAIDANHDGLVTYLECVDVIAIITTASLQEKFNRKLFHFHFLNSFVFSN